MKKISQFILSTFFISLVAIVMSATTAVAEPEIKGSPNELRRFLHPQDNAIMLHAEAEKKVYTDKAIISLIVKTEQDELGKAIKQNMKIRQSIRQKLLKMGVKPKHINNSKFVSTPEYGWFGKQPSNYQVVNRLAITITEEQHMQALAQISDEQKEVSFANTTFEYSKKDEVELAVKKLALEKILRQKEFYEQSLNVSLLPISFTDNRLFPRATLGARLLHQQVSEFADAAPKANLTHSNRAKAVKKNNSFDEISYKANLSVRYRVVAK